jgi:hypothetical protein
MLGFLRRNPSDEERVEIQEYLRTVGPLVETLDNEFATWLGDAADRAPRPMLTIEDDPDGTVAAVYVWKVADPARDFVQREPCKAAKRYHEAIALCLEARAAAADAFKEAADLVGVRDPAAKIAEANRLLLDADRERRKADEALRDLEGMLTRH